MNCFSRPCFNGNTSPNAPTKTLTEISDLSPIRRGGHALPNGCLRCNFCPKKLSTPEKQHEHMIMCRAERAHECTVCWKRFKARGGLHQHKSIHDQIKPFVCEVCPKRFTQRSHLDQHIRIHTGAKPFGCQYCGRFFRQSSQQLSHEKSHFNQKGRSTRKTPHATADERTMIVCAPSRAPLSCTTLESTVTPEKPCKSIAPSTPWIWTAL